MAQSYSPDLMRSMSEAVQCPICLELFADPRILPSCGHTLCYDCIYALWQKNGKECPVCRKPFKLDRKTISYLPKNFPVAQMVEHLKQASSPPPPSQAPNAALAPAHAPGRVEAVYSTYSSSVPTSQETSTTQAQQSSIPLRYSLLFSTPSSASAPSAPPVDNMLVDSPSVAPAPTPDAPSLYPNSYPTGSVAQTTVPPAFTISYTTSTPDSAPTVATTYSTIPPAAYNASSSSSSASYSNSVPSSGPASSSPLSSAPPPSSQPAPPLPSRPSVPPPVPSSVSSVPLSNASAFNTSSATASSSSGSSFWQSVSSFFSLGPSEPQPQPATEADRGHFAPWGVSMSTVSSIFNEWVQGRWFAPGNFSQAKLRTIQGVYLPFWVVSATTTSHYNAAVCHLEPKPQNPGQKIEKWTEVHGNSSAGYSKLTFCCTNQQGDTVLKLLEQITDWQPTRARLEAPAACPGLPGAPHIDSYGTWDVTWAKISAYLIAKEEDRCKRKLETECRCEKMRDVHVNVLFSNVQKLLVYLPVFICTYLHEDKAFFVLISGQTGAITGERPYGLGALANIGKQLFSSVFNLNR